MNVLKKRFQNRVFCVNSLFDSDRQMSSFYDALLKKLPGRAVITAFLAFLLIISSGCAGGQSLTAVQVQGIGDTTGLYTLILYHEAQYGGLKTIAFLVPAGNGYSLAPYAPEYDYTTISNVGGQEGLRQAIAFISNNPTYTNYEIHRISDPMGKTVGYEVRPLYDATANGRSDVMWLEYGLNGGTVNVHIHLYQNIMEEYESGGR